MPTSSAAVTGEFLPTPFQTHTTKDGHLLESVHTPSSPTQVLTDVSTVKNVSSTSSTTTGILFGTKALVGLLAVLTIGAVAAVAIPVGISIAAASGLTNSSTQSTSLTTLSTFTTTTATTTTITTATTSTTSTSRTTSTTGSSLTCSSNETVYGVWNTTAGGSSTISVNGSGVGNYYPTEIPLYACDGIISNAYTSFGPCIAGASSTTCGVNTGFYRTPPRGASLITGLQLCTGPNLVTRDPFAITFEGSNQPPASLTLGSSWTLLYNGTSGLTSTSGRNTWGSVLSFSNTVWYTSYRFLVTSIRGSDSSTWYSEVLMIGY